MMLLLLLLLTSSLLQPTSPLRLKKIHVKHEREKIRMADVILSSLNAATTCLEKKGNLYVDDVICLRILEAYVKGVMVPWARNPKMESINKKMKTFSMKLDFLLLKSINHLFDALSGNLGASEVLIQADFWKVPQPLLLTRETVVLFALSEQEVLKLKTDEICTVKLLDNSGNNGSCTYSEFCKHLMTMPATSHSQRIHQLMYFLFSKLLGCTNGMYEKTRDYLNLFCSDLMGVNAEIESRKYLSSSRNDFLGNILLCGTAGFVVFHKPQWLVNILNWQKTTDGCFSTAYDSSQHGTSRATAVLGGFLYALEKYPHIYGDLPRLLRQLPKLNFPWDRWIRPSQ